jgi:thiol:disulfide interchange protein DsbD
MRNLSRIVARSLFTLLFLVTTAAAEPVTVRLLVHPDELSAGGPFRVGALFDIAPGWHIYWRNPGESGLTPELAWQLRGARVGPVEWPAPRRFRESDDTIETFGYAGQVLLAGRAEGDVAPDAILALSARVLACQHECVPVRLRTERPLAPASAAEAAETRLLFDSWAARLPRPAAMLGVKLSRGPGGEIRVDSPDGLRADAFFPYAAEDPLRGVLALKAPNGALHHVQVDLSRQPASAPAAPGLLGAALLAFLGGLVLNLMPCVLPVLAIKIFSVTELAAHGRRRARLHAGAYAGGVLLSMGVLAALVVALRGAGASVGWGFQFQEPLFVAAVAAVCVVFALNLFGLFEIGAPSTDLGARATGLRRSFFDGLLAVVLATPCSAPFLGTAVGFAFASSAPVIVGVFAAIGAGLAAPYVLIAWVPGWARFVPRPGAWMVQLRMGLGFGLLATAVWLVWLFGRTQGADGAAALLAALLALSFVIWLYRVLPLLALGLGAALLLAAGVVTVEPAPSEDWSPYSPSAVEEALAAGDPVFVSFTADWCITCKVNERGVLADHRVREALDRGGFRQLRADWTRRDDAIRAELARFGRAGVPLYLVYHPSAGGEPILLPELLTVGRVLEALGPDA